MNSGSGQVDHKDGNNSVEMLVLSEDLNDSLAVATASQRAEMCTELLNRSFQVEDGPHRQVLGTKALIETLIWLAVR